MAREVSTIHKGRGGASRLSKLFSSSSPSLSSLFSTLEQGSMASKESTFKEARADISTDPEKSQGASPGGSSIFKVQKHAEADADAVPIYNAHAVDHFGEAVVVTNAEKSSLMCFTSTMTLH
jgi:hypothetical protein